MEDLKMMDVIERFIEGSLNPDESVQFEQLRRNTPELDQLVVEQQLFIQGLQHYGQRKELKHTLQQVHQHLLDNGEIVDAEIQSGQSILVKFWQKNRKTIAVAASIAGITALTITGGLHLITPKTNEGYLQQLSRKVVELEGKQKEQSKKINQLFDSTQVNKSPDRVQKSSGTSFLIDRSGYLVTNSHVINGASTLVVVNNGHEFLASNVYNDEANDIAILKIEDKDWKPLTKLPYTMRKSAVDLGEEIFTLGFPRNEVVYNKGYMSAKSGYNDDTLSIQIAIGVNPGNSGGPVLDKNGDIIGILSTRDKQANEVVFATKASNIMKAIEDLKKDSNHITFDIPNKSLLRGLNTVQQIKKLQDCVFMVKGY